MPYLFPRRTKQVGIPPPEFVDNFPALWYDEGKPVHFRDCGSRHRLTSFYAQVVDKPVGKMLIRRGRVGDIFRTEGATAL